MRGRWIKYSSHRIWPIHKIKSQSGLRVQIVTKDMDGIQKKVDWIDIHFKKILKYLDEDRDFC